MSMGGDIQVQIQTILQQLTFVTQNISDIRAMLVSQNEKIDKCMGSITKLQEENESLRHKVSELEVKVNIVQQKIVNQISYGEIKSRLEREKNIILFGIEETSDWLQIVTNIVDKVAAPHQVTVNKVTRLGKLQNDKARPIKVEMSSVEDALTILRNKSKLLSDARNKIKIRNDMTPKQLNELTLLQSELNSRIANGEGNLVIRFVRNEPKIVQRTGISKEDMVSKRLREEDDSPKMNMHKLNRKNYSQHPPNESK